MSPTNKTAVGRWTRRTVSAPTHRGFTLIELLVSMTVLVLVMVLTVQLVGQTTSITSASNKVADASTMARTVFDRFGDDLAGASFTGGQTALYYSGVPSSGVPNNDSQNASFLTKDSAIGFICKTRARKVTSTELSDTNQDVRGIVVAYKIRPTAYIVRPGTTLNIPLINRGDAEFTFSKVGSQGSNGAYGFSAWDMFGTAGVYPLPNDLTATTNATDIKLVAWTGLGDGVLRFHISFVLDDGRIVQNLNQTVNSVTTNVTYKDFQAHGLAGSTLPAGNCQPIAFSAATSSDVDKHYVTGMIVGIAVLDQATLNLGYAQDTNFAATLAGVLKRPTNDGETALGVWQSNLDSVTPLPVQRSIRFYQRFYPINL